MLTHPDGVPTEKSLMQVFANRQEHDPSDIVAARELAGRDDVLPIGLLFCDPSRPRYEEYTAVGLDIDAKDKLRRLEEELDRFAV